MVLDMTREPLPRRPTDNTYHQLGTVRGGEKIRADWPIDRRVRATMLWKESDIICRKGGWKCIVGKVCS